MISTLSSSEVVGAGRGGALRSGKNSVAKSRKSAPIRIYGTLCIMIGRRSTKRRDDGEVEGV